MANKLAAAGITVHDLGQLGQPDESDALGKCTTLRGWDKDTKSWRRQGCTLSRHGENANSRGNRTAACMKPFVLWDGNLGMGAFFLFFSWL